MQRFRLVPMLLLLVLFSGATLAQVPTVMNYQGRLTDNSPGQTPIDTSVAMEFRIYGSAMGIQDLLWTETWAGGVTVTNGIFSVLLGSNGTPLPSSVFTGGATRYLEIDVGGETLMPRQQLGAAGWAHQAGSALDADNLGGSPAVDYQKRVSTSCPAGQSIRLIDSFGNVACEVDDVGILAETDPQVTATTAGRIPVWNGSTLIDSQLSTNGNNLQLGNLGSVGNHPSYTSSYTALWRTGNDYNILAHSLHTYINAPSTTGNIYFRAGNVNKATLYGSSGEFEMGGDLQIAGQSFVLNVDGPEGDQNIDFYDNGIPRNERFQWDDSADRFEFSDDLHVFGLLTATNKAFVQNHPYRPDLEVVYLSLEGDESTTFTRGFGRLRDGVARVALGESFAFVTNPDIGVSAHVTPRGTWADLYVESVTPEELVVRSRDGENPDGVFDYIVFGLRIGFEEFPVFRKKRAEAFIPPQGYYEEEYQRDPALRDYNALQRYGRMAARVYGTRTMDLEASRRLREAIGEQDPTFDFPPGSTMSVAEMNQIQNRDEQLGSTLDEREIDR